MIDLYFLILVWYAVAAGLVLVGFGLFGRKPSGFTVALAAVVQLVLSIGLVAMGETAAIDTWEFFGYLVVALLVPVAGVFWALVETTRWSTVIMGASVLTIAVMLVRMQQIWTGTNPITA